MNKHSVDEVLSGSSPTFAPSIATEAALDALVTEARSAADARRKPRRRAVWLVPAAVLAVGALTAGTVAVEQLTRIETTIPVEYTTDTGITVSCSARVESSYFSPRFDEVTAYYENADFTTSGLGQRIYEYALVLTGDEVGTTADLPDSVSWLPGGPADGGWEPYEDRSALSESMLDFIVIDVTNELDLPRGTDGGWSTLESDCTGQLH